MWIENIYLESSSKIITDDGIGIIGKKYYGTHLKLLPERVYILYYIHSLNVISTSNAPMIYNLRGSPSFLVCWICVCR